MSIHVRNAADGSNRIAGESFIEVNTEDAEALGIHAQEMIAVVFLHTRVSDRGHSWSSENGGADSFPGGCGVCGIEGERAESHGPYISAASIRVPDQYTKTPHPLTPIDWKPEWIFSLADRIAEGMPLHEKTWGAHSCFLALGEQLLFSCEDIGRHNAIDKAVGYALKNGLSLEYCILYTSGRTPFDMTMKIIMAGIPVVAAKAIPMMDSVELAKKYRLTMICAARPDRMRVYTDFYH